MKKGIFSTSRKTASGMPVISLKNIAVPENPLSNRFTGARKNTMPMAFIVPERVSSRKFRGLSFLSSSLSLLIDIPTFLVF